MIGCRPRRSLAGDSPLLSDDDGLGERPRDGGNHGRSTDGNGLHLRDRGGLHDRLPNGRSRRRQRNGDRMRCDRIELNGSVFGDVRLGGGNSLSARRPSIAAQARFGLRGLRRVGLERREPASALSIVGSVGASASAIS